MYGAESVIVNLCNWFNAEQHGTCVAVLANYPDQPPELYQRCRELGVECHLISSRGRIDWNSVRAIRELALSNSIDIVHAHGYKADVFVYMAMGKTAIPCVATCHNWIDEDWKASLYGYLDRRALSKYSCVAAVTGTIKRRLERAGVHPDRIEVIQNGIDLQPFRCQAGRAPIGAISEINVTVGFIGRLSREKGPDIFVRAARDVLQRRKAADFLIVGNGPEMPGLKQQTKELGIEGRVRFLGYVRDMPLAYRGLDIVVSSSRLEGLPMVVLEAMASGLPVIASSVGDVPKLIDDGRTGLLIPPENAEMLARAILRLIDDPQMRRQLGDSALRFVTERFSNDRMSKEYLRFYERVMPKTEKRFRT